MACGTQLDSHPARGPRASRTPVDATLPRSLLQLPTPPGNGNGRTVIAVRSRGCVLFRRGQGCVHCGLCHHGLWSPDLTADKIVAQFRRDLAERASLSYSTLCLYTAGSFLDDEELPSAARRAILSMVAEQPSVRRITLESRPEFISDRRLTETRARLGDRTVEVGMGLESMHSQVRNRIIGKRTTLASYRRAVACLHRAGLEALLYVLVKPPHLSERAALDDALQTAQAAFAMQADAISLEPVAVQEAAPLAALYRRGEYRPPWLWTLVELARRTAPLGQVRIGGGVVVPTPIAVAHNCRRCTPRVWKALRAFERTQQVAALERLACPCRTRWEAELAADATASRPRTAGRSELGSS